MNQIDLLGFKAIDSIQTFVKPEVEPSERKGTVAEQEVIDMFEKLVGPKVFYTQSGTGKITEIFLEEEIELIGFNKNNYPVFDAIIKEILKISEYSSKASEKFLRAKIFDWCIQVYRSKQAELNLSDFLKELIEDASEEVTFFFPLQNIEIENQFEIGNVEFTYFSKQYFDDLYTKLSEVKEGYNSENFNQIFRADFQGKTMVKVTVFSERDKAEEIAMKKAELSVDVLKMFSESAVVPEIRTMFDLTFRLNYQISSNYLTFKPTGSDVPGITTYFSNQPFNLTADRLSSSFAGGLKIFSEYITEESEDELYSIIIQSIQLYANAISNWDLHLRCASLITIIESMLLRESEENKMEIKAKARISKLLSNSHEEKQRIKEVIGTVYIVRHKMLHKAKRIDFDHKHLSESQMWLTNSFLQLISLHKKIGFKNKEEVIVHLNNINS